MKQQLLASMQKGKAVQSLPAIMEKSGGLNPNEMDAAWGSSTVSKDNGSLYVGRSTNHLAISPRNITCPITMPQGEHMRDDGGSSAAFNVAQRSTFIDVPMERRMEDGTVQIWIPKSAHQTIVSQEEADPTQASGDKALPPFDPKCRPWLENPL
jgi:hypothetical protein